jgi:hypothetical protein
MRRDKVGGLVQQFWAAWAAVSSGSRRRLDLARCLRLASKAEKYVFQLVHADPTRSEPAAMPSCTQCSASASASNGSSTEDPALTT